ncbi:hypothetical protein F441_08745 [Phytophthora nicotianae CJ01A1]|uniref:Uncharacterized protein n=1 Tax=Phytophthora nicotianae CJ01A1 TaxID=1317063 RepID=W2X480_PHYNI|nr:hypothetical protein F441_08745 [Phytophthora nicotianae CJ01A1]
MTRTVYHVVIQLTLIFVVIRADQGNSSSGDDSGASGGRSYNVRDFAQVTYIPAEDLQDQLLNTADIAPDMLIAVASSYSALDDDSIGVGGTTSPNTTVLASILIVPSFANDSTSVFESTGNQSEPTPRGELSGRTQLMYNCTSATDLWNLLEDPNVVKLEDFQQFQSNTSNTVGSSSGSNANASAPREIIAVAVVQIENCSEIERSSRGRPVVLNSFFGTTFQNSTPTYLYTNSSVVLGNASGSAFLQLGECRLRLEMTRATLPEVYPQCKIRFQSTDLETMLSEHPTAVDANNASTKEQPPSRHLNDANSFGFVKDPSCTTQCGAGDLDIAHCYAPTLDGQLTSVPCIMQFYTKNIYCNNDCGDQTGYPYYLPALDVSQCYSCYSASTCPADYLANSVGCCRILACPAITDPTLSSPKRFTLNLQPDGITITRPSMPVYSSGDCSDPTNPSSDCCRITCENCFVNMSITSFYADVDVYVSEYFTASEMKLAGNSAIKFKVVSPQGCKVTSKTFVSWGFSPVVVPLGATGFFFKVSFSVDLTGEIYVKPHGTSVEFGATIQVIRLTAGSVNFDDFVDKQIVFQGGEDIRKNGVDIIAELSLGPTLEVGITFLQLATIGVKTGIIKFVRLESAVKYPEQFAALTTSYLDASSKYRGGDCTKPHFMEYRGQYGYKPLEIKFFAAITIPWVPDWIDERPLIQLDPGFSKTMYSGCISSKYDAIMQLTTAANAVTSATVAQVSSALQKVLMWALKIPDIDPNYLKVTIYTSGQISIAIAVPPSVADKYLTQSDLETQFYLVARTASFADSDGGVGAAAIDALHSIAPTTLLAAIPMTGQCPTAALVRMVTTDLLVRMSANYRSIVRFQSVNSKKGVTSSACHAKTVITDPIVKVRALSWRNARPHDVIKNPGKTSNAWSAMTATMIQAVRASVVYRIIARAPDVIILEKLPNV